MSNNYEEKSDFEINKAVSMHRFNECIELEIYKEHSESAVAVIVSQGIAIETFDLNNPSDAWPIIELIWERLMQADSYYQAHTIWEAYCFEYNAGKLRAAMICFLKMKDEENKN